MNSWKRKDNDLVISKLQAFREKLEKKDECWEAIDLNLNDEERALSLPNFFIFIPWIMWNCPWLAPRSHVLLNHFPAYSVSSKTKQNGRWSETFQSDSISPYSILSQSNQLISHKMDESALCTPRANLYKNKNCMQRKKDKLSSWHYDESLVRKIVHIIQVAIIISSGVSIFG